MGIAATYIVACGKLLIVNAVGALSSLPSPDTVQSLLQLKEVKQEGETDNGEQPVFHGD